VYFVSNFYSRKAWIAWGGEDPMKLGSVGKEHRIATSEGLGLYDEPRRFPPVKTFDELLVRISFLQLMNKRLVLYFRGLSRKYDNDLPSIFRGRSNVSELRDAWTLLDAQARGWLRSPVCRRHPRPNTLRHYPQAVWALQQHYKDLLKVEGRGFGEDLDAAATPLLDVTHSPRVAAFFATEHDGHEPAYVLVFGLPQTTGSITFSADEQLQLLRLSAVCPPMAKRPILQEAYLVGRFPLPTPGTDEWDPELWNQREQYFSLLRRVIAVIPLQPANGGFATFWGSRGFTDRTALTHDDWFEGVAADVRAAIRETAPPT
jgi:hypothetical protein